MALNEFCLAYISFYLLTVPFTLYPSPPSFRTLNPSVHNPKSSQPDVLLTSLGTPEEECGKIVARAFLFSILFSIPKLRDKFRFPFYLIFQQPDTVHHLSSLKLQLSSRSSQFPSFLATPSIFFKGFFSFSLNGKS